MQFRTASLLSQWEERCDQTEWVLGVVYKTEGPCYRKAGAMMLFSGDGQQLGLLSGGCLESDIQKHARIVMQTGKTSTHSYDERDEDGITFQLGIGCGGAVHIMLMPVDVTNNYLHLKEVNHALSQHKPCLWEIKIHDNDTCLETRINSATDDEKRNGTELVKEFGNLWLKVCVSPSPHLLVVGGGIDAVPVVAIARNLDWKVTLWDPRPANARRDQFMSANTILKCDIDGLKEYVLEQQVNAAIVMSHNVAIDASVISSFSDITFDYLGLLGPRDRRARVLGEAGLSETSITTEISGPAGFALGGELPESIALSIVAECHSCFYGNISISVSGKKILAVAK